MKLLFEETVSARLRISSSLSECQDLRAELDDLQRQHDEALHEISNKEAEVTNHFTFLCLA